jgi:hypothetical protein
MIVAGLRSFDARTGQGVSSSPTSAAIAQEVIAAGVVASASLNGLEPSPVAFTGGAIWQSTNVERLSGGGMRATAADGSAYISTGDPEVGRHSWQFRSPGDATELRAVWCAEGDPASANGYAVVISRASAAVAWDVALEKLNTGTLSPTVHRFSPTNLTPADGSTSLTGIIPDAETSITVRLMADSTKIGACVDWGAFETVYLEMADTDYRGDYSGWSSSTPSGTSPTVQSRLQLPHWDKSRPPRLTSPTCVVLDGATNVVAYPAQYPTTGPGDVHEVDVSGDVHVKCSGELQYPLFIFANGAGTNIVTEGLQIVAVEQPGNGPDGYPNITMNDGSVCIGYRLPYAGGLVRVDCTHVSYDAGSYLDVTGHRSDCFIFRGGDDDANDAALSVNRKMIMGPSILLGWRTDNTIAGNGLHGDLGHQQGIVTSAVLYAGFKARSWGSMGVYEWGPTEAHRPGSSGYYPGLQCKTIRNIDYGKDFRYGVGDPQYHASDATASEDGHASIAVARVVFDGPSWFNWSAAGGTYHGNYFAQYDHAYHAGSSTPGVAGGIGDYRFTPSTVGYTYFGQGEAMVPVQMVMDLDKPNQTLTAANTGINYVSPHFIDGVTWH